MSRHGEQVNLERFHVHRNFTHALYCIHVQQDLAGATQLADGGDVLHHADLVVDVHDADQDGVITQCAFDLLQSEQAVGHRLEVGHLIAFALQLAAGIQYRLVLGLGGNDVLALAGVEVGDALMARLLDSVAPEVKTISRGSAPISSAT